MTEQSSLDSSQVTSGTSSASHIGFDRMRLQSKAVAHLSSFGGPGKSGEKSRTTSTLSKPLMTGDSSQVTSGTSSAPPMSTKAPSVFGSHMSSNTKALAHLSSVSVEQGRAVRIRNPVLGLLSTLMTSESDQRYRSR